MKVLDLPEFLRESRVAVVDVETTGFRGEDRVIEVGLIWIEACEVIMEVSRLCDPGFPLPAEIARLTGIKQADMKGAGQFSDIADFLIDVLAAPTIVVAYNHAFDFRFLQKEVEWCDKHLKISEDWIDPLPWVRREDAGKKCSLTVVAARRGVKIQDAHSALGDCYTTVGVMNTVKFPQDTREALKKQKGLGSGFWRRAPL